MAKEKLQYGQYYHIYNRGNNGENLFIEWRNYPYFLQLYARHIQPIAETFAYCLLPNHFHFALRIRTEEEQEAYFYEQNSLFSDNEPFLSSSKKRPPFKLKDPSRAFNNLFIAYARAFNKATSRTGALFESPFERKLVTDDAYLLTLISYIHHNPQRHGFVDDFYSWPWTSYGALTSEHPTRLNRAEVLAWFDGRDGFMEAHVVEPDAKHIRSLLLEDWI